MQEIHTIKNGVADPRLVNASVPAHHHWYIRKDWLSRRGSGQTAPVVDSGDQHPRRLRKFDKKCFGTSIFTINGKHKWLF